MAVTRGGVTTAKATAPKSLGSRPAVPTTVSPAVSKGSVKSTSFKAPTK